MLEDLRCSSLRAPTRWVLAATLLVALAACTGGTSSSSGRAKPTTTTTTVPPSRPADPGDQAALDEAAHVMKLLAPTSGSCATPSYEANITQPSEYGLPLPVTRARCNLDGDQIAMAAFADPADAERYPVAYNTRMCTLSNKGQVILGGTYWVVQGRTATNAPRPSTVRTIADRAGGTVEHLDCPPPS